MNGLYKNILVAFFAINALIWGLGPHTLHCSIVKNLNLGTCPSHNVHITLGLLCFLIAVLIAQHKHLTA